jgi:hypothetical protein
MGSFGGHRDVVMSKIDLHRPLPIVEKQHEKVHLNVVSPALPVTTFRSRQKEDALILDAAEVFVGRLYCVTWGWAIGPSDLIAYQLWVRACWLLVDIRTFWMLYHIQNSVEGFYHF